MRGGSPVKDVDIRLGGQKKLGTLRMVEASNPEQSMKEMTPGQTKHGSGWHKDRKTKAMHIAFFIHKGPLTKFHENSESQWTSTPACSVRESP